MIKYYIRTTMERALDETLNQIDYELLIDLEHRPVMSFIEQLEFISETDAVLLEDDVQLCKNFKNRIEKAIAEYPNKIINFFYSPTSYFKTREAMTFAYNQCTYYPKGIAKILSQKMREIEAQEPNKYQYDVLESKALRQLNITHIQYRPCLVQHLDFKSLIGNRENSRITPFFIDYLDELGITYDDCEKHKWVIELKYLLKDRFKNIIFK